MLKFISIIFFGLLISISGGISQGSTDVQDSLRHKRAILEQSKVNYDNKEIKITIQNVDISRYPQVKVIVEAYNMLGNPLDTLYAEGLTVLENGVPKKVVSVEKISVKERIPVDFIFVIDQTGSMQSYIDAVKKNLKRFTSFLQSRGIDYNLGLIMFSDFVDKVYQPTDDVIEFLQWLGKTQAAGGGDVKENALEALKQAAKMKFRPSATKVAVVITDAPYHQAGETGSGKTDLTTRSALRMLNDNEIRVFTITPPRLEDYKDIAYNTRGSSYDIDYAFSSILDIFSSQLTNLFALKYISAQPAIPDSINIALINEKKQELTKKTIPIVELGRKLIIENMLYATASSDLPQTVEELEVLTQFMQNKPNVVIMVEGHTDNVGSDPLNDVLSLRRAESVKKYLLKKGISAQRIKTKGYGEKRPIASNSTDFGRRLNRRTEIIIVAK